MIHYRNAFDNQENYVKHNSPFEGGTALAVGDVSCSHSFLQRYFFFFLLFLVWVLGGVFLTSAVGSWTG